MRRKSERNKSKSTPDKKSAETTAKKSRRSSRRRKRSTSRSSSEDSDDAPLKPAVPETPPPEVIPPVVPKVSESRSNSDEDKKEEQPIWKVKTTEAPSGEIQKLKICLQRPPTTPERIEKSPRRRRGKASSQSDDASLTPEEKPHKRKTRKSSPAQVTEGSSLDNSVIEEAEKDECLMIVKETNEVIMGKGKLDSSQTTQESENEECIQDSRTEKLAGESLIESKIEQDMGQESAAIKKDKDEPQEHDKSDGDRVIEEKSVENQGNKEKDVKDEKIVEDQNNEKVIDNQKEIVAHVSIEAVEGSSESEEKKIVEPEATEKVKENVESDLAEKVQANVESDTAEKMQDEAEIQANIISKQLIGVVEQETLSEELNNTSNIEIIAQSAADTAESSEKDSTNKSAETQNTAEEKQQISEVSDEKQQKSEEIVEKQPIPAETDEKQSTSEETEVKQVATEESDEKQPSKTIEENSEQPSGKTEVIPSEIEVQKNEIPELQKEELIETNSKITSEVEAEETKSPDISTNKDLTEGVKEDKMEETESEKLKEEPKNDETINKTSVDDKPEEQINKKDENKAEEQINEISEDKSSTEGKIEDTTEIKTGEKIEEDSSEIKTCTEEKMEEDSSEVKSFTEERMEGSPERIIRKRNWGKYKAPLKELPAITSHVITSFCPSLVMLNNDDVKLEIEEPKESKPIRKEREVTIPSSPKEDDLEKEVSNIGLNRKISIVNDEASKLQPPPSPAKNPTSPILYITNLVRPFTVKQLQELLSRTGKIVEDGFWTDKIKSKCYVQYETEDEAEATRNALHGVQWPIGNGKKLIIDFGTQESMTAAKNAIAEPPAPKPVPEKGIEKISEYKKEDPVENDRWEKTKAAAPIREWDVGKVPQDHRDRSRSRDRNHSRSDRNEKKRPPRTESPSNGDHVSPRKKKKEEPEVKMMDDLFHKTKSTPSIYWLPLSPEQIAKKQQQRLQRMAEHKRRMEESRRMERDFGRGAPRARRRSSRYDGD